MQQSDSTQNAINSTQENVVSLDRSRLAKHLYQAQKHDVFQQRLAKASIIAIAAMQAHSELASLLHELRELGGFIDLG